MSRGERSRRKKRSRWPGLIVGATLVGVAVATEMRKPPDERTWEGRIGGLIPYDLRRPTFARAVERLWNPANPHIVVPTVFGVGWTVNVGRLVHRPEAVSAGA